ncbi:MAG: hypothetical protein ACOYNC_06160 [Bacteroidales bacterium]
MSLNRWNLIKYILFDGIAVAFIILAPALSHMFALPLWYLEPMRLMLVLAIMHTSKPNGYLLAAILPFCSWVFSGHPELIKMLIITMELVVNVALFYWLNSRLHKPFAAMLGSILASKLLCYLGYWVVFSAAFLAAETGMVFMTVQVVVSVLFALYAWVRQEVQNRTKQVK